MKKFIITIIIYIIAPPAISKEYILGVYYEKEQEKTIKIFDKIAINREYILDLSLKIHNYSEKEKFEKLINMIGNDEIKKSCIKNLSHKEILNTGKDENIYLGGRMSAHLIDGEFYQNCMSRFDFSNEFIKFNSINYNMIYADKHDKDNEVNRFFNKIHPELFVLLIMSINKTSEKKSTYPMSIIFFGKDYAPLKFRIKLQ